MKSFHKKHKEQKTIRNRHTYVFSVLCVLLLVLTACSSGNPKSRPLYSGSQGIMLSFPEQNNFEQYANDDFSIAIRLENDGAEPILASKPGVLNVIYDPSMFTLLRSKSVLGGTPGTTTSTGSSVLLGGATPPSSSLLFEVSSRSQDNPVTGVEYLDFTFKARNLSENRPQATSPIVFQACYPYVTTFIQNVCVDRDFYTQKNTPVCLSRSISGNSQGAPIAVTNVEPRFTRVGESTVKPRFRITLTNLQDGFPIYNASLTPQELASGSICTLHDFNKAVYGNISVTASLGSTPLDCGVNGMTRFERNTADIVCGVPDAIINDPQKGSIFATGANYEALLTVQLHYFYISQLTANVKVDRP